MSERRACRLVGLSRSSWRDTPQDSHKTTELRERIKLIAHQRRRFGYRRIYDLLRFQGVEVNHKRVYRLYTEQKLSVKRRKKAKRPITERAELLIPDAPNQVWSIDFVMDSLANGRKLKCLTIADDKTHECIDIAVDHGISGLYVTRILEQAARFRGFPQAIRTDGGPGGLFYRMVTAAATGAPQFSAVGLLSILLGAWSFQSEQIFATWFISLLQATAVVIAIPLALRIIFPATFRRPAPPEEP